MRKKIFLLTIIICCLYLLSLSSAMAKFTVTLSDEVGDVYDSFAESNTSEKPNLDIKTIECTRDYRDVTIKLTVQDGGVIENKGDMSAYKLLYSEEEIDFEDPEILALLQSLLTQEITMYTILIYSSNNSYEITYINNTVLAIANGEEEIEKATASANGGILTVNFDLLESKENLTDIQVAITNGIDIEEAGFNYNDLFSAELNDPLSSSEAGEDDDDGKGGLSSGFIIFIIIIIIAVICGVAVLIYFLRR